MEVPGTSAAAVMHRAPITGVQTFGLPGQPHVIARDFPITACNN